MDKPIDNTSDQAIVLFAHGSRQSSWRQPFDNIAQQLSAQHPDAQVELAFLEFMSPTLTESLNRMAEQGVRHATVVPLFFGVGNHVARDLDELILDFSIAHPNVQLTVAPAVGQSPVVLDAMTQYAASFLV